MEEQVAGGGDGGGEQQDPQSLAAAQLCFEEEELENETSSASSGDLVENSNDTTTTTVRVISSGDTTTRTRTTTTTKAIHVQQQHPKQQQEEVIKRTRHSFIDSYTLDGSQQQQQQHPTTVEKALPSTTDTTTTVATKTRQGVLTVDHHNLRMSALQNLPQQEGEEEEPGNTTLNTNSTTTGRSPPPAAPPPSALPGAYMGAPGEQLRPTANFAKSQFATASSITTSSPPSAPSPLPFSSTTETSPSPRCPMDTGNTSPSPGVEDGTSDIEMQQEHLQQEEEHDNEHGSLVQARQVTSSHFFVHDQKAVEVVDPLESDTRKKVAEEGKKWLVYAVMGGLGLAIIIIAMSVGLRNHQGSASTSTPPAPPPESTVRDNTNGTSTTLASDNSFVVPSRLIDDLPNYTLVSLEDPNSPQSKALSWLQQSYPNMTFLGTTTLPQWRRRQLLALATFYFALDGPSWMWFRDQTWLDPSKHECNWYSNTFGEILLESNSFVYQGEGKDICNENGEYIDLNIAAVGDAGIILQDVSFPPELSLLTSLMKFRFHRNGVTNTLNGDILPLQFYNQLSNLQQLTLGQNSWNTTIPSQLGLLTKLEVLKLNQGNLFGTLPTELGSLTLMKYLLLGDNSFTGSIPVELSGIKTLLDLTLHKNQLTGTVPAGLSSVLQTFRVEDNPMLSGTIPEELCSIASNSSCIGFTAKGKEKPCLLKFDCTSILCGCQICTCNRGNSTT